MQLTPTVPRVVVCMFAYCMKLADIEMHACPGKKPAGSGNQGTEDDMNDMLNAETVMTPNPERAGGAAASGQTSQPNSAASSETTSSPPKRIRMMGAPPKDAVIMVLGSNAWTAMNDIHFVMLVVGINQDTAYVLDNDLNVQISTGKPFKPAEFLVEKLIKRKVYTCLHLVL